MAVPLTEEQKQSPLYKYYELPIEEVPEDLEKEIMQMSITTPGGMAYADINSMFDDGYLPNEFGLFANPDGGFMSANLTKMPGVTPEMFDWWFAWHGVEPMRYIIWDKDDHYYCQTQNLEQALDDSLSLKERYWNTTHEVHEAVGPGQEPRTLMIRFVPPEVAGFDPEKLKDFKGTIVCAPMGMIHFVRPTEDGCELRTRFMMGYKKTENGIEPDYNMPRVDDRFRALLMHNIKEFRHLAKILPDLYAEFKDNFKVGLR